MGQAAFQEHVFFRHHCSVQRISAAPCRRARRTQTFFLFIARRNRSTNIANIGHEKIEEYTHVRRVRIKTAISFLASLSLVYVEHIPSKETPLGISNAYRIVGLESYNHMGNTGTVVRECRFRGIGNLAARGGSSFVTAPRTGQQW